MRQINNAERFFTKFLRPKKHINFLYNFHAFGVFSAFKRALKMAQLIPQPRHLEPGASNDFLVSDLTDLKEYIQENCKPSMLLDYSEYFVFVLFWFFFSRVSLVINTLALVKKDVTQMTTGQTGF